MIDDYNTKYITLATCGGSHTHTSSTLSIDIIMKTQRQWGGEENILRLRIKIKHMRDITNYMSLSR